MNNVKSAQHPKKNQSIIAFRNKAMFKTFYLYIFSSSGLQSIKSIQMMRGYVYALHWGQHCEIFQKSEGTTKNSVWPVISYGSRTRLMQDSVHYEIEWSSFLIGNLSNLPLCPQIVQQFPASDWKCQTLCRLRKRQLRNLDCHPQAPAHCKLLSARRGEWQ